MALEIKISELSGAPSGSADPSVAPVTVSDERSVTIDIGKNYLGERVTSFEVNTLVIETEQCFKNDTDVDVLVCRECKFLIKISRQISKDTVEDHLYQRTTSFFPEVNFAVELSGNLKNFMSTDSRLSSTLDLFTTQTYEFAKLVRSYQKSYKNDLQHHSRTFQDSFKNSKLLSPGISQIVYIVELI